MDDNRFDNLTRLMGAGTDRRRVLRMLFGGTGALVATGVTRQLAGAQNCDPNAGDITCPEGSFHAGKTKKPGGACCNGNGNCCSNVCTDGMCIGGSPPECVTAADCGAQPDSCTEWLCVGGTCELNGGCPAGELCCPAQGGSCAECCDDGDCPSSAPICYNPGDPTNAYCVECVGNADCDVCESCESGTCVPYARYCEATQQCYDPMSDGCCPGTEDGCGDCFQCTNNTCTAIQGCCTDDSDCTDPCTSCIGNVCTVDGEYCDEDGGYCYNTGTGGCCTDDECGGEYCIDGECNHCPSGQEYCESGDYCYSTMTGGCCTDDQCGNEVCVTGHCCPPGDKFCPDGDYCYTERTGGCCTSDQCGNTECIDGQCSQCPPGYEYCEETRTCYTPRTGGCCTNDECGGGYCVDNACQECPKHWNYCKYSQQCYDPKVSCCYDRECDDAPGGECVHSECQYPVCDGKGDPCWSNDDCCGYLICVEGICKRPHHPHPQPQPTPPAGGTVSNLPATGSGEKNDDNSAFGITLATGAAALLAAKYLRQNATEETSEDA